MRIIGLLFFAVMACAVRAGEPVGGGGRLVNLAYISSGLPEGVDHRLILPADYELSAGCLRLLDDERASAEKPPGRIRGLVVALQVIGWYDANMFRQPGHLSREGRDKDRTRIAGVDIYKRRGVGWALGAHHMLYAPAIVKPIKSKSIAGVAIGRRF